MRSKTVAYNIGKIDAEEGEPCLPEQYYTSAEAKADYVRGYQFIKGKVETFSIWVFEEAGGPRQLVEIEVLPEDRSLMKNWKIENAINAAAIDYCYLNGHTFWRKTSATEHKLIRLLKEKTKHE